MTTVRLLAKWTPPEVLLHLSRKKRLAKGRKPFAALASWLGNKRYVKD
jgi:hypothetical protein